LETTYLNQLIAAEGGIYLLGEVAFSGFAIENFPDGKLQTQMALVHGRQDGVTRRWHPNGQLESEKSFRDGKPHGRHQEWRADGTLKAQSSWNAGACIYRSTTSDNFVTHYGYDFQNRQTSVRIEEVRKVPQEIPCLIRDADWEPQPPAGDDSPAAT
jgi:hypothetical protein